MLLFLEGVNLNATIFDTEDLSTTRGGSMLLEQLSQRAKKQLGGEILDEGASRALLEFGEVVPDLAQVEAFLAAEPYRHFTITRGFGETPQDAERAAREHQLRNMPSLSPPVSASGAAPCPLDHTRPAVEEEHDPTGEKRLVSASVAARRKVGRAGRPQLFNKNNPRPPQSFEEIAPDEARGLRPNVSGKIAVVVADGMGGTALRKTYADASSFSKAMKAFRERLAEAIERWAVEDGLIYNDKSGARARIDVLVWGGDDMTFVLPASHLLGFLEAVAAVFDTPFDFGKPPFGHRISCVIANRKTPIRLLKTLAKDAEEALKDCVTNRMREDGTSVVSIDVFESSPMPFASINAFRKKVYGSNYVNGLDAFTLADIPKLVALLRTLDIEIGPGLTMTQIHRALDHLRADHKQICDPDTDATLDRFLSQRENRLGIDPAETKDWASGVSEISRPLALALAQMSVLHSYADPIALRIERDAEIVQ